MMGVSQIAASAVYLLLTFFTEFCATLLHTICLAVLSLGLLLLTFINTKGEFLLTSPSSS